MPRTRASGVAVALVLVGTQLSLILRWLVPVNPVGLVAAGYDGGLFERLGASVAEHNWLGPLEITTLAKGPAYPVFMAMMRWARMPLPVGEQFVYLLGAAAIAACVWVVTKRPIASAVVYLLLAFEPSNYGVLSTQVTREHIYTGLSMMFLGGVFLAMYTAVHAKRATGGLVLSVLAGLSGGAFWLCREEGVWVFASVAFVVVTLLLRRHDARSLVRAGTALVLIAGAFYAPIAMVHARNDKEYGVALTTDITGGSFPEAFAAWSRVRGVTLTDFVPINAAQRAKVYEVSPSARLLKPRLESVENPWLQYDCGAKKCGDLAGSVTPWALRDAAFFAGKYDDERTFQDFFQRVADEITDACDAERLKCARKLPTSLQPFDRAKIGDVASSSWRWLRELPLHPNAFALLQEHFVNPVPHDDRSKILDAIAHAPKSQAEAVADARAFETHAWLFDALGVVYRCLFIAALLFGALGLAVTARNRSMRRRYGSLQLLVIALLGAVLARVILFAVIDTTQYFVDLRYQLVARSFLFAAALLGALPSVAAIWPKLKVKLTNIS